MSMIVGWLLMIAIVFIGLFVVKKLRTGGATGTTSAATKNTASISHTLKNAWNGWIKKGLLILLLLGGLVLAVLTIQAGWSSLTSMNDAARVRHVITASGPSVQQSEDECSATHQYIEVTSDAWAKIRVPGGCKAMLKIPVDSPLIHYKCLDKDYHAREWGDPTDVNGPCWEHTAILMQKNPVVGDDIPITQEYYFVHR